MNQPRRQRPPTPELDPRAVKVFKRVAEEFGTCYAQEFLYPHLRRILGIEQEDPEIIREAYMTARGSLLAFYCHYAFARRGKDRDDLSNFALEALGRVQGDKDFAEVLQMEDGTALWEAFAAICQEKRRKNNEAQNRGLIQGMLELAQEIYDADKVGSIANWMLNGIAQTKRLEPQFERVVDIRGVGPKSTSTFMRDVVYMFDYESKIEPADRIYIHPIDRWLRLMARYLVPEPGMEKAADWIIAGKISKYSRRAGVSGIAFNMGATYFGQKYVKDPALFEDFLKKVALGEEL
ncbi:MAG TPA: hypothetical protein VNI20_02545 [Fimbriimonadaceae bacterium]|nr:hypothetical protein [Fimbriimonadaceae bacterium]